MSTQTVVPILGMELGACYLPAHSGVALGAAMSSQEQSQMDRRQCNPLPVAVYACPLCSLHIMYQHHLLQLVHRHQQPD